MALAWADEKTWKLAFTVSLAHKPRIRQVRGGDVAWVVEEINRARQWFRLPDAARVISYYESGIDGVALHEELVKRGINSHLAEMARMETTKERVAGPVDESVMTPTAA